MVHSFIEILRRALDEEMARDAAVHLLGEDVAAGGAFGVTRGLAQKHGASACAIRPSARRRSRALPPAPRCAASSPVLEIMFIDFATLSMDCLVNQTAKYRYMSGGQLAVPLVVRTQAGPPAAPPRSTRRASKPGSSTCRGWLWSRPRRRSRPTAC